MSTVRGEAKLMLQDQAILLRPSFAALVEAEEELGSLFSLIEKASEGRLALREIISLLWHCATDKQSLDRAAFSDQCLMLGLAALTPDPQAHLPADIGRAMSEAPLFAAQAVRLAGQAALLLGWRPDEFWRATPAELEACLCAFMPSATDGLTQDDVARLQEIFPDDRDFG